MRNILNITKSRLPVLFLFAALLMSACMDDDNNPAYSDLRADFAMIQTNSSAMTVGFTTDNNEYKTLSEPKNISGARPDTTYRALVYYYETGQSTAELYGFTLVTVRDPQDEEKFDAVKTDPVGLQSVWISNNGSYINMCLNLMNGAASSSDTNTQMLDIVRSSDEEHGGITKLTLYHDQNNVPEYYSSTIYLSIPVEGNFNEGDTVNLVVNTYNEGEVSKIFTITNK